MTKEENITKNEKMIKEIIERNLTKTIEFLWRISLCKGDDILKIDTKPRLQIAYASQNAGQHIRAWEILACKSAHLYPENMVFCKCCDSVSVFVRNNSLLKHYHKDGGKFMTIEDPGKEFVSDGFGIKERGCVWDPYCEFLISMAKKNVKGLINVLKEVPLLWEACLELSEIDTGKNKLTGPLSLYYAMLLKVKQDIDILGEDIDMNSMVNNIKTLTNESENNCVLNNSDNESDINITMHITNTNYCFDNSLDELNINGINYTENISEEEFDLTNMDHIVNESDRNRINHITNNILTNTNMSVCNDKNLLAAFLHAHGENAKAIALFNEIMLDTSNGKHSLCKFPRSYEYVEVYTKMLENDDLNNLLQIIENESPGTPECYTVRGICLGRRGELLPAIAALKKSLRLRWDGDVDCLLGNAYAEAKKRAEALACFRRVIDRCPLNSRLARAVAHGLYMLGEDELAVHHTRRALSLREDDASMYKLIGRLYMRIGDERLALRALRCAVKLGSKDAMLYIAETYRKMNKPDSVIKTYEKYIEIGGSKNSNKEAVAKYLFDYYQEKGNVEKSSFYKLLI